MTYYIVCLFEYCTHVHVGTVYFQVKKPSLLFSGTFLYTYYSSFFIFPSIYLYYLSALEMYAYEKADGFGQSRDLVIQGFVRFVAISTVPLVTSVTLFYLLVSP